MATIHKERTIEVPAEQAWEALADWGALHERLVPGFVTATELDGSDRIVTFFNGAKAREVLITSDDATRRLVWSVVEGPYTHHNGVAQVHPDGEGRCRFVWTADLLPEAAAGPTGEMMERGIQTVKDTLESASA
jgi:hypothetical protein